MLVFALTGDAELLWCIRAEHRKSQPSHSKLMGFQLQPKDFREPQNG